MPTSNDLRKTLTDAKPLYFAAGVFDKIREEAPERIAAVRATDPKEVQARVSKQARETQAKVSETLGHLDTDLKKLRDQAQHLALQSLGLAAEYAVKARETYDELADRGRGAVANWRGQSDDAPEVTVEREPVKVAEPPAEPRRTSGSTGKPGTAGSGEAAGTGEPGTARKTTTAKTTTAKTGPAKSGTARTSTAKSNGTAKPGAAKSDGTAKSGTRKNGTAGGGRSGTAKSNGDGKAAPESDA